MGHRPDKDGVIRYSQWIPGASDVGPDDEPRSYWERLLREEAKQMARNRSWESPPPDPKTAFRLPKPIPSRVFAQGDLNCPVAAPATVKSPFGPRGAPTKGASTDHTGVDFRNPLNKPIYSTRDGTVAQVFRTQKGGNSVIVQNVDGSVSGYAHSKAEVKPGAEVRSGQRIGHSDGTGNIKGPHLHYTYRPSADSPKMDPLEVLRRICKIR